MAHSKFKTAIFWWSKFSRPPEGNVIWAWMRALKCLEPVLSEAGFRNGHLPGPRGVEAYVSQPLSLSGSRSGWSGEENAGRNSPHDCINGNWSGSNALNIEWTNDLYIHCQYPISSNLYRLLTPAKCCKVISPSAHSSQPSDGSMFGSEVIWRKSPMISLGKWMVQTSKLAGFLLF